MNLERLGVLKTVPLQSFNFNDIRFDRRPTIFQIKEGDISLQRVGWITGGLGDLPGPGWILRASGIVDSQGKQPDGFRLMRASDEPTWKADLEKNLATWTEMAPYHPVTILGKGGRSCACFQFHVPGELWVLSLPCVQPL
ncbi:hypothetical protein P691DRAFT_811595 [Macrolepiota fuliginosa MF-IS2]|uniref:Uncharacterized protein n=1 Tax=Macrolepiota fuliginosa MF-IS2 TaxID=1400762 RepID=A0A9P5X1P9_9AGAR|nr:hypothetical protein P691DRAFT_813273 [Macrolepiota fuliginosa MF-IS2]KAF9441967.1 hypothetical protein P691DRAFT_811595 [Macrolepiota fuliginosa MF-IS2]